MKIIKISEERKKKVIQKSRIHTDEWESAFSRELSDKELEVVVGGMSPERFDLWRSRVLNKNY